MKNTLLLLLLLSSSCYSDVSEDKKQSSDEDDDVIVVHDSWQDAQDDSSSVSSHGQENVVVEKFTEEEAIKINKDNPPPPQEITLEELTEKIKAKLNLGDIENIVQFAEEDAVSREQEAVEAAPVVEDESTRKAREQLEEAEAMLKANVNSNKAWDMIEQSALANYAPATLKLAWAYLFGNRFNINPRAAHTLFQSLADQGNPEAQMGLAFLYATGTVVNSSQSQALLYYTFGAFGGSHWAQMALGYR